MNSRKNSNGQGGTSPTETPMFEMLPWAHGRFAKDLEFIYGELRSAIVFLRLSIEHRLWLGLPQCLSSCSPGHCLQVACRLLAFWPFGLDFLLQCVFSRS
jgi:hypothetical protein